MRDSGYCRLQYPCRCFKGDGKQPLSADGDDRGSAHKRGAGSAFCSRISLGCGRCGSSDGDRSGSFGNLLSDRFEKN